MKQLIRLTALALVLTLLCGMLLACRKQEKTDFENVIHFDEKYVSEYTSDVSHTRNAITFSQDGTGQYERYFEYVGVTGKDIYSYRVDFVWRQASNGAIYLFKKSITYLPDHTSENEFEFGIEAIYFGEDFLTVDGDDSSECYIRENSELAKLGK